MTGILDLLKSPEGREIIEGSSKQFGINKADAASAMASAIPMILGAMHNNASNPSQGGGLLDAILGKHANGGLLDNLSGLFNGGNLSEILNDGGKILGHIFGGQEQNAAHVISKTNGINLNSALNLLKMAAPFLMSYIGKKAVQHKVSDTGGLSGLLGGLLGDSADLSRTVANKVQNFDNNNDTIDTISEFVNDGIKKSGIIGDLLNSFMK
jgi:hypothetical protein